MLVSATSATAAFVATGDIEGGTIHAAARTADKPPPISWADAKHRYGWVSSAPPQRRRTCSRDWNVLCATNDGGKHWRAIFRGGNEIFGYLRWSKNAGVVSAGAKSHGELWTRDGGRHWWGTRAFWPGAFSDPGTGFGAGPRFSVGQGTGGRRQLHYAYATQWPYRVLGWVPTRPLKCAAEWARWGGETTGPKNICGAGPVGGDGLSAAPAGPAARLTVIVNAETADGLVRSNPAGIDCGTYTPYNAAPYRGTACAASFGKSSTVTLYPLVSVRSQEVDWTGCSRVYPPIDPGAQPWCGVTLAGDTQVTATFPRPYGTSVAR